MKTVEFNKLIKKYNPQYIIYLHTTWRIYLTNKQLDKVIELKNKKGGQEWVKTEKKK